MTDTHFLDDLRARHGAGEKLEFIYFWGDKPGRRGLSAACFSQWYGAPFEVDGRRYATAEHFMMAEKAALFGDDEVRARILDAPPDPAQAKALGRRVRGFDEALWVEHRFAIVVRGNHAKFRQNPALGGFLRATGSRIIVEASPVDPIWGIGLAQDAEGVGDPSQWRGLNLLGFALMRVRDLLHQEAGQ